jgi:CSLREA domain-containing protein
MAGRLAAVVALAAAGLVVEAGVARAATITVTTFADQLNTGGPCSLREAVRAANFDTATGGCPAGQSGRDTIVLRAGFYQLTRAGADNDGTNGDLDFVDDATVRGAGPGLTVVDSNVPDRVFHVLGGVTVTIAGMTVQGGFAPFGGGLLADGGRLTVSNANVVDNSSADDGAGIAALGAGSVLVVKARR